MPASRPKSISRREFLTIGLGLLGATALSSCAPSAPTAAPKAQPTAAPPATAVPAPTAAPAATAAPAPTAAPPPTAAPAPTVVAKPAATAVPQATAKTYGEAPMLADLVKAGKLPPVQDRLPKEPKVTNEMPPDQLSYQIGQYGGAIRTVTPSVDWDALVFTMANEPLLNTPGALGKEVTPNILRNYKVSDDQREFTCQMREGLRWSDGTPVTAEDIRFNYEEVLLNKELTATFPQWLKAQNRATGTPMQLQIIDQFSFKITFDKPYGGFLIAMSIMGWRGYTDLLKPAHYLKQFHKKYADPAKLEAAMKDAKTETWVQLFTLMIPNNMQIGRKQAIDMPQLTPWVLTSIAAQTYTYTRNPYYFKVDSAGNQLPYIDRLVSDYVTDQETINMKQLAGEVDVAITALMNAPLFKEREKASGIQTLMATNHVSPTDIYLNLTFNDPTWRKVVGDKRFRQALNMSIDRKETIDALYFGFAEPPTLTPAKYDPAAANKLLDEIGMDKRDANGYRLAPDGKPFSIPFEIAIQSQTPEMGHATELFVQFFEKVGIRTTMKILELNFFSQRNAANQLQATVLWATTELWYFNDLGQTYWGPLWQRWWTSGGKEGEEPPADVKALYEKIDSMCSVSLADGLKAYEEVRKMVADNTYFIINVERAKRLQIFNAKLANIPTAASYGIATTFQAEQLFFKS